MGDTAAKEDASASLPHQDKDKAIAMPPSAVARVGEKTDISVINIRREMAEVLDGFGSRNVDIIEVKQPLIEQLPSKVRLLIDFIKKTLVGTNIGLDKAIGGWCTSYEHIPEGIIPFLYTTFSHLHDICQKEKRIGRFSDFGGGDGIIAAVANIAGFDASSIEIQKDVHLRALDYYQNLVSLGVIDPSRLHLAHGTYYTPSYFRQAAEGFLKERCINKDRSPGDLDMKYASYDLRIPGKSAFEDIDARLSVLGEKADTLENLGLIGRDGKLDSDVIYNFPSDPLYSFAFVEQLTQLLRPGARVVIPWGNSQVRQAIKDKQFAKFELETVFHGRGVTRETMTKTWKLFVCKRRED